MTQEQKQRQIGLWGKIAALQAAMERVPKNGYNRDQNYRYALESDVMDCARPIMAQLGLAWMPPSTKNWGRTEKPTRSGGVQYVTWVEMQFGLVDAETGEMFTWTLIGEGMDSGDKSFYKAYSGGSKYALLKGLGISTGDDPEGANAADKEQTEQRRQSGGQDRRPQGQQGGDRRPAAQQGDGAPQGGQKQQVDPNARVDLQRLTRLRTEATKVKLAEGEILTWVQQHVRQVAKLEELTNKEFDQVARKVAEYVKQQQGGAGQAGQQKGA